VYVKVNRLLKIHLAVVDLRNGHNLLH